MTIWRFRCLIFMPDTILSVKMFVKKILERKRKMDWFNCVTSDESRFFSCAFPLLRAFNWVSYNHKYLVLCNGNNSGKNLFTMSFIETKRNCFKWWGYFNLQFDKKNYSAITKNLFYVHLRGMIKNTVNIKCRPFV